MAPDTPDGFTAAISATGTAAGPNTFRRVGRSRLATRSTAGVAARAREFIPYRRDPLRGYPGDSKGRGQCPSSLQARRTGAAGNHTGSPLDVNVTGRAGGPIQTCGGPGHRHTESKQDRCPD